MPDNSDYAMSPNTGINKSYLSDEKICADLLLFKTFTKQKLCSRVSSMIDDNSSHEIGTDLIFCQDKETCRWVT